MTKRRFEVGDPVWIKLPTGTVKGTITERVNSHVMLVSFDDWPGSTPERMRTVNLSKRL